MNPLFYFGLALGLLLVIVYLVTAAKKQKKPELGDAVGIAAGAVSIMGAVRLIGFVFTDQFVKIASSPSSDKWWSLSVADALFLVIGGLALAWVSGQAIYINFAKVR